MNENIDPSADKAEQPATRYVIDRDGDLWRTVGTPSQWECLTTDSCLVFGADLVNVCGPLIELVPGAVIVPGTVIPARSGGVS